MLIITLGNYFSGLTAQFPAELDVFCVILPQDPINPTLYFSFCDLDALRSPERRNGLDILILLQSQRWIRDDCH